MPAYVFKCQSCGAEFEMIQASTDPWRATECAAIQGGKACRGRVVRVGGGPVGLTLTQTNAMLRGAVVKSEGAEPDASVIFDGVKTDFSEK